MEPHDSSAVFTLGRGLPNPLLSVLEWGKMNDCPHLRLPSFLRPHNKAPMLNAEAVRGNSCGGRQRTFNDLCAPSSEQSRAGGSDPALTSWSLSIKSQRGENAWSSLCFPSIVGKIGAQMEPLLQILDKPNILTIKFSNILPTPFFFRG